MRRTYCLIAFLMTLVLGTAAAQEQAPAPIPEWFKDHIHFMTKDGGRWITSNAQHISEQEPYDAYGLSWHSGVGGTTLHGRMFALKDGVELGTLWEFLTVWHPGERRVKALQFGLAGVYGVGFMVSIGEGQHRLTQEFYSPDGSSFQVGHEDEEAGNQHHTRSFDVSPDGSWSSRRSYVWQRNEK